MACQGLAASGLVAQRLPHLPLRTTKCLTMPKRWLSLRDEIDRADREMHTLLMRRSQVIEQLIAAKGTQAHCR
jgi:hypothetical protein